MADPQSRTVTHRHSLSEPDCPPAADSNDAAGDSKNAAGRSNAPRLAAPSRPEAGRRAEHLRFFTLNEVAERLRVSSRTVRRWIKAGALPVHRIGGLVRISEADFAAFLALRREA
jgi:excisionase family DNA binding protein